MGTKLAVPVVGTTGTNKVDISKAKTFATPGVLRAVPVETVLAAMARFIAADWGDMCDDDKASNDAALVNGDRLFAAYACASSPDGRFWIIAEAVDVDAGENPAVRARVTALLPSEC